MTTEQTKTETMTDDDMADEDAYIAAKYADTDDDDEPKTSKHLCPRCHTRGCFGDCR